MAFGKGQPFGYKNNDHSRRNKFCSGVCVSYIFSAGSSVAELELEGLKA